MKSLPVPACLFLLTFSAAGQPKITGHVRNAASNTPLASGGAGVAQGSYIAIYGSGLGPDTAATGALPYPTTLGGATVNISPSSGTNPIPIYLTYVRASQINAIVPSTVPFGDAVISVTYNGATSAPEKIRIVKSSFGIFSAGYPVGPAATINLNTASLYNLLSNAANGGDVLELFGTGLGPVSAGDNVPPGAVSPANIDVKVLVGNQAITPLYAGRAPQYPALDQINFQLPNDGSIVAGCWVPVAVQVNGAISNYATLATATGGRSCPAPLGLSASALQKLDLGGTIKIGELNIARSTLQAAVPILGTIGVTTEQAGGVFASLSGSGLLGLGQTPGAIPPVNATGTCIVQTIDAIDPPTSTVAAVPQPLNAGAKLTLSGQGKTKDLPFQASTGYAAWLAQAFTGISGLPSGITFPGVPTVPSGLPSSFLATGAWSISGGGGSDIGAFTAGITVPAFFNCTNCASITTIDRGQPLTIKWTGGGGDQDYVQVGGLSTAPSLADASKNVAVVFACTAKASDGAFTVPASVLSQLPPASADLTAANLGYLEIVNGLGAANGAFTAPGLDAGYFGFTSIYAKLVGYN